MRTQGRPEVRRRQGASEVVALAELAAEEPQVLELLGRLDALGHDLKAQRGAQVTIASAKARSWRPSPSPAVKDSSIFKTSMGSWRR